MPDGTQHHVLFIEQGSDPPFHRIVRHDQAADVVWPFGLHLAICGAGRREAFQPPGERRQRPGDSADNQRDGPHQQREQQQRLADERGHDRRIALGHGDAHQQPAASLLLDGGDQQVIGLRAAMLAHHCRLPRQLAGQSRIVAQRTVHHDGAGNFHALIGQDFGQFLLGLVLAHVAGAQR